jgi:hypothetical protein
MELTEEERKRRARICVKRWVEQHREQVRQYNRTYSRQQHVVDAKRVRRQEQAAKLIELGLLERLTPGRPRVYSTVEEAEAAKRKQQRQCNRASRDRLAQAVAALRELERDGNGTPYIDGHLP